MRNRIVLTLFTVSGGVALAQEIAWSELLARTLGHGMVAVTVVAAVFLGGLAAGSAWGGRLAAASARPLRLYGVLELGIGAACFVLAFLLPHLPHLSRMAGRHVALVGPAGVAVVATAAALLLLPATFMMGATLPTLVRHRARDTRGAGLASGLLAGVNAGGGAAGAMAAVFLVLPSLGTHNTLMGASALNLLVGLGALLLDRSGAPLPRTRQPASTPGEPAVAGPPLAVLAALLFIAGAGTLALQVIWTRVFGWMVGASVYAFGILLTAFVGGLALGGLLGGPLARRSDRPLALYARLLALLSLIVAGGLSLVPFLPPLTARLAAASWQQPRLLQLGEMGLALMLVFPAAVVAGAAFPVTCRILAEGLGSVARGVGWAGAWLTAGNVAGCLTAGLLLPRFLGSQGALQAVALAFLAVSFGALATLRRRPRALQMTAAALTLGLLLFGPRWDPALMASGPAVNGPSYVRAARATGHPLTEVMRGRGELVFVREGSDALVTIRVTDGGTTSLQINGKTEASTGSDLRSQILSAQLPLLHTGSPSRAMVIGLASGITAGSLLQADPGELVVVEVAPTVVEAARSGPFDEAAGRALEDPRLHLVVADARAALLHDGSAYDLITSQPSNPWVPGAAALYTTEFFHLVRARLAAGGVFCQWVQAYGFSSHDLLAVLRTFRSVFPHAALYEESVGGEDYFLIGSPAPLSRNAATLLSRLSPPIRAEMARGGLNTAAEILGRLVLDGDGLTTLAGDGLLLTDNRLRLVYTTPLTLWRDTASGHARTLEKHRKPPRSHLLLDGLSGVARRLLTGDLARVERQREADWAFITLLDQADDPALETPEVNESIALARAGLPRAAYARLLEAVSRRPGPAALQVLAGDLAYRLGEGDLAEIHYQAALGRQPDSVPALAGLALVQVSRGELEKSAELFELALGFDAGDVRSLVGLGGVRLAAGETAAALELLEAAVRRAPDWSRAWSNLGVALRRSGRLEEAEAAYRRAVGLQPGLGQAWYNLGVVLQIQDRPDAARAAFAAGLAAAPEDCDLDAALAALEPAAATADRQRPDCLGLATTAPQGSPGGALP